jgi:hypothetical protein
MRTAHYNSEDFRLKYCMEKVHTLLRTSGSKRRAGAGESQGKRPVMRNVSTRARDPKDEK